MTSTAPLRRLLVLAGWNATGWIALAIWTLVSSALIFRWLGPADLGVWATIGSLRALFALVEGGLAAVTTREAARLRSAETAAAHLGATRSLYAGLGAVTLAIGVLAAEVPGSLLGLDGAGAAVARAITLILAVEAAVSLATGFVPALVGTRERFDVLAVAAFAQVGASFALFLALLPGSGVVAAALATLGGRLVWVAGLAVWLRLAAPELLRVSRPHRPAFRAVLGVAAPLWLGAISAQLAIRTDVPIVAGFFGAVAASHFALGAGPPLIAVGLLFVVVDVVYPRLAIRAAVREAQRLFPLLPVSTGVGTLGFLVVIASAPTILEAWVGTAPSLAVTVMTLYSVAWIANVPAHVVVLIATASGRDLWWLTPVVIVEAIANLALSIALAAGGLPAGPAIATLVTLAIADLVVVPAVLLPRLGLRLRDFAGGAAFGYAVGLAIAIPVIAAVPLLAGLPAAWRLLLTAGATAIAAFGVLAAVYLIHDRAPDLARSASASGWILRHGGWWVWLRQRAEVRLARPRLAAAGRAGARGDEALVTVRIATRDRGDLVVSRAIRSALEQTHRNIEVVVVGDDWDETTERAVRSVTDPRVRCENIAGPLRYPSDPMARWMVAGSAAMNRGVALARGEWIAPLDDDDEFTPDHIEVLLQACRERDLDMAYGIAEMEVEPGRWEHVGSWPLRQGQIVHASVLYSAHLRSIVHDPEVWRLRQPGDWNLWSRMRDAGARIGFVERVVCRHYVERRHVRAAAR